MILKANLINYFDVWGNEEDGYEVNNLCKEGTLEFEVEGDHFPTRQEMLDKLIEFGFIIEGTTLEQLDIQDFWPYYELYELRDNSNDYPIGRLEFED